MITAFILNFFATVLGYIFGLIPQVTEMPEWYTRVHDIMPMFSGLHALPFIGTIFDIAMVILPVLIGWQVVVFSNWLYNKIRGSG